MKNARKWRNRSLGGKIRMITKRVDDEVLSIRQKDVRRRGMRMGICFLS